MYLFGFLLLKLLLLVLLLLEGNKSIIIEKILYWEKMQFFFKLCPLLVVGNGPTWHTQQKNYFFHYFSAINIFFYIYLKTEISKNNFIYLCRKKSSEWLLTKKHQSLFICEMVLFFHTLSLQRGLTPLLLLVTHPFFFFFNSL